MNRIKIVFTDLDGTLLGTDRSVSTINLKCLEELGRKKIIRVIATGRSYFSYKKAIEPNFPADYLIFSTGAGILDLATEQLLYSAHLNKEDISLITKHLQGHNTDFMVHHQVPDNHRFVYYNHTQNNTDFNQRLKIYKEWGHQYQSPSCLPDTSAQFIAIFNDDMKRFNDVKQGLGNFQITRTTSPLDGKSIWMEIFPAYVSKGEGARWLCQHLKIAQGKSMGIGNDYNDISLLDFTTHSYLVANAPSEIHEKYCLVASNDENGFYDAVMKSL